MRGPLAMAGHHQDPAATAAVSRGGRHHTGDLGYLDAENHLPRSKVGKVLKGEVKARLLAP